VRCLCKHSVLRRRDESFVESAACGKAARRKDKMSNTLNGEGENFLRTLDFNSAIAACNAVIAPPAAPTADDYLCRGYAHCFVTEKDNGNFDKAIADCSMAITQPHGLWGNNNVCTAYRIRAYAFYLKGDFASALRDCGFVLNGANNADDDDRLFVIDLQTRINYKRERYDRVITDCGALALGNPRIYSQAANIFQTVTLADEYREACKKLKGN